MIQPQPKPTLFPYTTLFRSGRQQEDESRRSRDGGERKELPHRESPHGRAKQGRNVIPVPRDAETAGPLRRLLFSQPSRRPRSEEHTSELQSHSDLVCRLLLE